MGSGSGKDQEGSISLSPHIAGGACCSNHRVTRGLCCSQWFLLGGGQGSLSWSFWGLDGRGGWQNCRVGVGYSTYVPGTCLLSTHGNCTRHNPVCSLASEQHAWQCACLLQVCMPQPASTHGPFGHSCPVTSVTTGQRHPGVQVTMQLRVPRGESPEVCRAGQTHPDLGNQGRLLRGRINRAETRMMSMSLRRERGVEGVGSLRVQARPSPELKEAQGVWP